MTDAAPEHERYIQTIHSVPGRARFRLPWLRHHPDEATRLSEELAREPGMLEVEIRSRTGSVLCRHDPHRLDEARLRQRLIEATGVQTTLGPDEPTPVPPRIAQGTRAIVARELAGVFNDLDDGVLRATQGALDMGTLLTIGLAAAGALQVAVRGQLPPPPWFTLGWWGFRTFLTFERDALARPTR
jgi:hypothetical protein